MIPFAVDDCQHGPVEDASANTVYVGGLHGTMRARHVADVFAELFGAVTSVTLYVDRFNYPTGKKYERTHMNVHFQKLCNFHSIVICDRCPATEPRPGVAERIPTGQYQSKCLLTDDDRNI